MQFKPRSLHSGVPQKFHHQANYYKLENEILRGTVRG